jgi:hypothetical protein
VGILVVTNPFSGIISAGFKELFANAIDALIEPGACSSPSRIVYGDTKFIDCPNCIGGRTYQAGGPVPFKPGQTCPYCPGAQGRIPVETSENIDICVIWDYKKWLSMSVMKQVQPSNLHTPFGFAQTLSSIDLVPKLKRAKYIVFDTNIENYERHKFTMLGEPEPVGFGENRYILTLWERLS